MSDDNTDDSTDNSPAAKRARTAKNARAARAAVRGAARLAEGPPAYVDDRDLATLTPIKRIHWQEMRIRGGGPPYSKVGKRVIYRWADVVAWLEASRVGGGK